MSQLERVCVDELAILGVGLIGGSMGLAAKAAGAARHVIGLGRNPQKLAHAQALGCVDAWSTDLAAVASADLVVVATPVGQIAEDVLTLARLVKPGAIISDAGSTKGEIVRQLDASLPLEIAFVGGHPIAGSEKGGAEHARADLFQGQRVVLTPGKHSSHGAMEWLSNWWGRLGALVTQLTPEEHDRILAAVSHVPHAVAALLASSTPADCLSWVGTGWRDTCRVAGGDPGLWRQILVSNRADILAQLQQFAQSLEALTQALASGDEPALEQALALGRQQREQTLP